MANDYSAPKGEEQHIFHQHDSLKSAINGALLGGGAGFTVSAVQNSLARRNVGAWGVFTRTGGTVAMFTAGATVYEFARDATANLREKDDTLNISIASFLSGATIGLRTGRIPQILGFGAAFSIVMSAFEFTGGSLRGGPRNPVNELDEFDRKEAMRLNRRRPIDETIANIGEGRGIHPPGYEERRRERLKEKYGVEIKPVSATVE
ncbi:uncharacterized protein F4822DRAFT_414053 [Hypoxylon trugodes]|uniref:uncharacterized protein n=1 Tax=Hypoxylon trugodes TaxID=326681 RepID=UPI00219E0997|nr:uncharacterized protein F4822DRAFT_414053 [Hypoxylon trugodes]KAI1385744.1 hypothetical protein F4822DRAFT_414053 [Hypoxylon trugodes]